MIYCFTGTGNSEFVAKRVSEKLGMELCLAYECIRDGVAFEPQEGETLVFVCPTYSWRIPRIFESWISASEKGEHRAYFLMDCGSDIGNAKKYCAALCEKMGYTLMGVGEIIMPENYVAMFPVPKEEKAREIVKKALPVIDAYAESIAKGEKLFDIRTNPIDAIKSGIVNELFYKYNVKAKKFRALDSCVGCGKCAKTCITHNITIENGKPRWGDNCIHCMRCICDCKTESIEYGNVSVGKPRYHCPKL